MNKLKENYKRSEFEKEKEKFNDLIAEKERNNVFLENEIKKKSEQINKIQENMRFLEGKHENFKRDKDFEISNLSKKLSSLAESVTKTIDSPEQSILTDMTREEQLMKKFSSGKYVEEYIIETLHSDVKDFCEFTRAEIKKIKPKQEKLLSLLKSTITEITGGEYEAVLYGSHSTGLCLQWSDLDIVLCPTKENQNDSKFVLSKINHFLSSTGFIDSAKFIDTTTVPLIKMTASKEFHEMQIDISIEDGNHFGLKCVNLVRSYMKEYEALEPLVLALKNVLKSANLNDPYKGGLSSYGLILMIVSFLQHQKEKDKDIGDNGTNLGRLFLEFLWYYGLVFDQSKLIIFTYDPNNMENTGEREMGDLNNLRFQTGSELVIVDPLNKNNNVAKSSYHYMQIKMAFLIGFVVSHEECECSCHYFNTQETYQIGQHNILKRIFNSVKRFNFKDTIG